MGLSAVLLCRGSMLMGSLTCGGGVAPESGESLNYSDPVCLHMPNRGKYCLTCRAAIYLFIF